MIINKIRLAASPVALADMAFNHPDFMKNVDEGRENEAVDAYLENAADIWELDIGEKPSTETMECAKIILMDMTFAALARMENASEKEFSLRSFFY